MSKLVFALRLNPVVAFGLLVVCRGLAADEVAPPNHNIRLLAVGDTGDKDGSKGVGEALLARSQAGHAAALLFLGDNFYMRGLNRRDWPQVLHGVMEPFRPAIAKFGPENVHAVSGNHDYYQFPFLGIEGLPMGFFSLGNDREALQHDLWRYHYWYTDDTILRSADGALGVQIVFVDSARAIAAGPRYCSDDVFDRLRAALSRHRVDPSVQWRIVAAHHPLETVGDHGNYGQPMGLVRRIRAKLLGGQDTSSSKYQQYRHLILAAIKASQAKVHLFLAGHDHSLQLLARSERDCPECPGVHVVSGAGSQQTKVRATSGADYTPVPSGPPSLGPKGFVEVDANAASLKLRFFSEGAKPQSIPMGPAGGVCEFTVGPSGDLVATSGCTR